MLMTKSWKLNQMISNTKLFQSRLKLAMNNAHINGAELAEACNASRSSICRYLNGERIPKIELSTKMADILGVSVSWLLGLSDPDVSKSEPKPVGYNPIEYWKLTKKNRLLLKGYYQALLDSQTKIPE